MSLLVIDGNGDAARRKKLHRVSRLALTEEEAPYFELVALKEWDDPRYVGGPAKLCHEPIFEIWCGGGADLMMCEQLVLAPFERLVVAAEQSMFTAVGEKVRVTRT